MVRKKVESCVSEVILDSFTDMAGYRAWSRAGGGGALPSVVAQLPAPERGAAADLTMETCISQMRGSTAGKDIFSYCGSLLQRRMFHLKPGKPPTKSACLQGVISIIRVGKKAWLTLRQECLLQGEAFS